MTDLGGEIVDDVSQCSVLVTDKVRRTAKFLCMLAKGVPIVSPAWLAASKDSKSFQDPWPHLVVDAEAEKKWSFDLRSALRNNESRRLLDGFSVFASKSTQPPPDQLKDMVTFAGGKWLSTMPRRVKADDKAKTIVVSCAEDKKEAGQATKLGLAVVEVEFLLAGFLKRELAVDKHRLNI